MILSRNYASSLLVGALIAASATSVTAGDYGDGTLSRTTDRCSAYGAGFIDMGNGTCRRAQVRVEGQTRNANVNAWGANGTSSTALRSDGLGMLPGIGDSSRLRVRNGLESYSPFR